MTEKIARDEIDRLLTTPAYHRWLGLWLEDVGPGAVTIGLPFREEFLADVDGSYVHGGVLAALADVAGDFAVIAQVGYAVPTIDLRVDYLRAARPGMELRADGVVARAGRSVAVANIRVTGDGRELLLGRGLYATGTAPPAK